MNYEPSVGAAAKKAPAPRHIAIVRITHWIVVLSVLGLLVSGIGILVSHPRLYWGETGSLGTESLIDLPHSVYHRSLGLEPAFSFLLCVDSGLDWPDLCCRQLYHAALPQ